MSEQETLSEEEMMRFRTELNVRGVRAELECYQCNELLEVRILPSERPDDERRSICRDCAVRHGREVGLI